MRVKLKLRTYSSGSIVRVFTVQISAGNTMPFHSSRRFRAPYEYSSPFFVCMDGGLLVIHGIYSRSFSLVTVSGVRVATSSESDSESGAVDGIIAAAWISGIMNVET